MKHKKTVAIIGSHPSKDRFDWSRTDCDIWVFNEAAGQKLGGKLIYPRVDVCFQLHSPSIWRNTKNRTDPEHYRWLRKNKKVVVYMQDEYKDVPMSKKYPLEEILNTINVEVNGNKFKYLSSSPEYALALAVYLKYERIEVYGIELETNSEYQHQRTGFAFWSGFIAGNGIELKLFNKVLVCPLYGYEGDVVLSSKQIKDRIKDLQKESLEREKYKEGASNLFGRLNGLIDSDISQEIRKGISEVISLAEKGGMADGKIKENEILLDEALAMEKNGEAVFSIGGFDSKRVDRNRQYTQEKLNTISLGNKIENELRTIKNIEPSKRKEFIDVIGTDIADLFNRNVLLAVLIGAINEMQYYMDSVNLTYDLEKNKWQ